MPTNKTPAATLSLTGSALDWCAGLLPAVPFLARKTTLPVLAFAKLTATPDGVLIEATNLETGYLGPVPVSCDTPGCVLLPLKRLTDLLRGLPADTECTLEHVGRQIVLRTDRGRWTLPEYPVGEFPATPTVALETPPLVVPAEAMARTLDAGLYAHLEGFTRPQLSNILLKYDPTHRLHVVSTDGNRLAFAQYAADDLAGTLEVRLPAEAARLVARWLKDAGEKSVTLAPTASCLAWTCAGVTVTTRLTQDLFPEWELVVPEYPEQDVMIPRASLLAALQRGATQQEDKEHDVSQLTIEDGCLVLETLTRVGDSLGVEELTCVYTGPLKHLRVRSILLLEALRNFPGDPSHVLLCINSDLAPVMLRPEGDDSAFAIVMGLQGSRPAERTPAATLAMVDL